MINSHSIVLNSVNIFKLYGDVILYFLTCNSEYFTGYRYYSAAQLIISNRIQVLKGLGFGISAIGKILTEYDDAESLRKHLIIHLAQMKEEEEVLQQKLTLLQNTIHRLGEDRVKMNYDVSLKEIPERYVASLRDIIPAYDQEGKLWARLEKEAGELLQLANHATVWRFFTMWVIKRAKLTLKSSLPLLEPTRTRSMSFSSILPRLRLLRPCSRGAMPCLARLMFQ
ncbi:DNA-binding transcriptional MerR regulator [Paenibacillus sp. DS2015]|uniref:hypothetical protein n=1 Tax=Paenibacillus sp. DS2015 TaxID=3373917 RepID=UPI003D1F4435